MAELVYDENGRLLFTKEMKEEYTILFPTMLPVHFGLMARILETEGFHVEMLTTNHRGIVDEGLKYVHNDTCYPALLVIGQLIDAVKSGKYDMHKVALLITQTGGGCRASNYIHLLRKALEKAGLSYIPVISVNLSGLEPNPGFKLGLNTLRKAVFAMMYGDIIVQTANQVRPYEVSRGQTDETIEAVETQLLEAMNQGKGLSFKSMVANFDRIVAAFKAIPVAGEPKVRVGVVGEILVKFHPTANNQVVKVIEQEGCEANVPGLVDFFLFGMTNAINTNAELGTKATSRLSHMAGIKLIEGMREPINRMLEKTTRFQAYPDIFELASKAEQVLSLCNTMGEGWLLTAEMCDLIETGTPNIVCIQPFACLPNHVVGKGVIKALKKAYPQSNIVAVDYDPGASEVNQLNRIKLMLSTAKKRLAEEEAAKV